MAESRALDRVPICWRSRLPIPWSSISKVQPCYPVSTGRQSRLAKQAGFSLHAGVAARADQRDKLDRPGGVPLCRYISRPAVSEKRLSLTAGGQIRYQLKTPYRDGTTHVIFNPLDFLARLAALVPKPRVNLTRFHGVFARGGHPPNHALRSRITPGGRGRRSGSKQPDDAERTSAEQRAARACPASAASAVGMTWAQARGNRD